MFAIEKILQVMRVLSLGVVKRLPETMGVKDTGFSLNKFKTPLKHK